MQQYRALLTDLDGTLISSADSICSALTDSFRHVGATPPSKEAILNMFGLPVELMLVELTEVKKHETARIDEFIAEYKRQYPIHMENASLIPNAKETMENIARLGYPICLITSERKKNAEHILKKFRLNNSIMNIVSRDDVENFKPHPEPLLKAAGLLNLKPGECAYIGESPFDMQAGLAAGVYTIGVPSGNWSRQSLVDCKPDIIIDYIGELIQIIK